MLAVPMTCENAKARLVCFPHSGGGPSTFAAWSEPLGKHGIEVVVISAPGRERRLGEEAITDCDGMVKSICEALTSSGLVDDVPYAFLGHSLGSLIAFETARKLDAELVAGRPRPVHLIVSGHGGPNTTSSSPWRTLHGLSDELMLAAVGRFGDLPPEVMSDAELAKAVIPAFRGDFQLYANYAPQADRRPLPVSVTAMGGLDDSTVPVESLKTWAEEISGTFASETFPGGHFFIQSSMEDVLKVVQGCVLEALSRLPLSALASNFRVPEGCNTQTIYEVVRHRSTQHPTAEAVVDDHVRLTYAELMRQVEGLAALLSTNLPAEGETVTALLMPHSATYVTSMLAIWSAASSVLVLEMHFNAEMNAELCAENGVAAALTIPGPDAKLEKATGCKTLVLEQDWASKLSEVPVPVRSAMRKPQDLAILMMTSGTTGRPKTIAGSHLFMHLGALAKAQVIPYHSEDEREGFNVMFVWEVLRPLLLGLTSFVLPDDAVLDPQLFVSCLEKHRCTRVLTTASLLGTILQNSAQDIAKSLGAMRTWVLCGEVLPMKTVHEFRRRLPNCRLVNDYSSWEGGDVSYAIVSPTPVYEPSTVFAAVGVLAPGSVMVIVDPITKKVLPKGIVGELYVGGASISSGYYQKPEATAERFVEAFTDEMRALWTGPWYKSGDGGRIVGEPPILELRGRIDTTVKIRGFKVGIPVVETAILEIEGVALCGVVPVFSSPGTVDSLLCYLQPETGLAYDELLQRVKQEGPTKMPRWMMPVYWQPMPEDALSGGEARKLNRKKLALGADLKLLQKTQAAERPRQQDAAAAEEDGVRAILRAVWAKALNINASSLALDENFFDLGGHSALAAQIATELSGTYGLAVSVLDIYSSSTLGAFMDLIAPGEGKSAAPPTELRRLRVRENKADSQRLAVVGLAGRFPGADTADAFYSNLRTGTVSATFLSKELLKGKGLPEQVFSHPDFVPCAYKINDADKFDHHFFGIGRHEASLMDPQHRLFIEATWGALENAALNPKTGLSDTVVGVFAAAGIDGYLVHHLDGDPLKDVMDPQDVFLAEIGNEKDYIATRVAYLLDFTGPAMNVNSACSSALVAIAQGSSAITSGQCDAVVAGASSITFPNLGYRYQDGLVNSVDGYVRPFDVAADGTVFGDAVGAVVLRRVEDVSGNLVWGVVRGFAVSNDGGQKAGYAAPSSSGQSQAICRALEMMGDDPWSLSYVECHATGTRVGDGIEMRGLMDSFKKVAAAKGLGTNSTGVALGSVKGNIAHANCAAGVTGFVKLMGMMRSQELVPTANFKTLNPKIDFKGTPFQINGELCSWDAKGKTRRAGVSSFGIGGTNAHIVVDEAPAVEREAQSADARVSQWQWQLVPFSAKGPGALKRGAGKMAEELRRLAAAEKAELVPSLAEVAFTMQAGRASLPLRKAIVVPATSSDSDARSALLKAADVLVEGMPDDEELDELEDALKKPAVALVFPGQGSQYFGMGQGLYDSVPLFRQAADECCEQLLVPELLGEDLRPVMFASPEKKAEAEQQFARPTVLQPSLFVIEYAMSRVLQAVGVVPIAVAGHSLGEYAAAVVGGLLSLEAACSIVAARAKSTETLSKDGSMLSVADWSVEELEAVSRGDRPGLWLAATNSPAHSVISGETAAVDALETELKKAGRKAAKLHVRKAFHSGLIAEAADTLKGLGLPREDGGATLPVASNLTGGWMSAAQLKAGSYWTDHMRGTVRWRENAEKLMAQWKPAVVLECGPGNTLSTLSAKCVAAGQDAPAFLQAMRHPKAVNMHDVEALLGALGRLWETGVSINWTALQTDLLRSSAAPLYLRLPTYAFEPTSLWKRPERSIYVEGDAPMEPVKSGFKKTVEKAKSSSLIRFGEQKGSGPSIKAYCLPFASGSSILFAPWAEQEGDVVEVVALELPGRGGLSDEKMPASEEDDNVLLEGFCDAILADLQGAQYVLVGFSMGGNISAELALRLQARGAPLPLGLYIAGRRPPAINPGMVPDIDMTNEELAEYAFAPPEVANSPEFAEHVVPMLRADLELDSRVEKRLSAAAASGLQLPASMALELFCGTADSVAPWAEAMGWQRFTTHPAGLHFFPGGHEFMREHRTLILGTWRRDSIGRLVQRRSAEVATLAAQGFSAPVSVQSPPAAVSEVAVSNGIQQTGKSLPLHAVRWVRLTQSTTARVSGRTPFFISLDKVTAATCEQARLAMLTGNTVVIACPPSNGIFADKAVDSEVSTSWQFVHFIQDLLDKGASGRLVIICPAAASGAMVAGASKAVAMEASEFRIQRIFVPAACLIEAALLAPLLASLADQHSSETDIWVRDATLKGPVYAQRLERMIEPSSKLTCVSRYDSEGNPATYVLTGATGGLGSALVEWLLTEQGLLPEQLVLLRRAGSQPLAGALAKCRVVEVTNINDFEVLCQGLRGLPSVSGVFHLAGVLDDGIVQGMTKERLLKVAQPKCGMLVALLRAASELSWNLNWVLGFSSTSSLFGYGGQSNYCAANAMLDQLAAFGTELPENDKPPCRFVTVNWGPWGEAGMAQVGTKAYEQAVKEGDTPLKTATAIRCLAAALRDAGKAQPAAAQFAACDVEWQKSTWSALPILDLVFTPSAPAQKQEETVSAVAEKASQGKRALDTFLVEHTNGASWQKIQGKSLHQLGMDSLEIVQLRGALNKAFGVNVPLSLLADPSLKVAAMAESLWGLIGTEEPKGEATKGKAEESKPADSKSALEAFMVQYTGAASWSLVRGKSLFNLGLDSLEVVQLRNSFNKHFNTNAPLKLFADASQKVSAITDALSEHMSH